MEKEEKTNIKIGRDEIINNYLLYFIVKTYPIKTNHNNAIDIAESIQERINNPHMAIDIDKYVGKSIQTFVDPEGILKAEIKLDSNGIVYTLLGFNNKEDIDIVGGSPLRKKITDFMGLRKNDFLSRMFVSMDTEKLDPLCREILEKSYYRNYR